MTIHLKNVNDIRNTVLSRLVVDRRVDNYLYRTSQDRVHAHVKADLKEERSLTKPPRDPDREVLVIDSF